MDKTRITGNQTKIMNAEPGLLSHVLNMFEYVVICYCIEFNQHFPMFTENRNKYNSELYFPVVKVQTPVRLEQDA